jgi:hypothetical protein
MGAIVYVQLAFHTAGVPCGPLTSVEGIGSKILWSNMNLTQFDRSMQ